MAVATRQVITPVARGGGSLGEGAGTTGVDDWQVDPRANSLSQGANRWNYGIAGAKAPMSLDETLPHRLT